MKKILIAIMLLLPIAGFAHKDSMSTAIDKIIKEAKANSSIEGFDVLSLGPTELGLTRSITRLAAILDEDDDDIEQALMMLDGIKKMVIVDYEDASPKNKARFNEKIEHILANEELLMEAKDEEDIVRIYGTSDENGEEIRNFVLYCPEEGDLICISGKISLKDVAPLIND